MCYRFSMTDQEAVKELVRVAGSQKRLAEIIGVPEERISRWMHGHHRTPHTMQVILELVQGLPRRDLPERWK